jgi:CheY-like chemotaxis protein
VEDAWDDLAVRREDRRLRALIADDDEGVRHLLRAVLELEGWEVRDARDGDEAVAMTEAFHPDAILMDLMMPNTDGITAVHRIRENEGNRDIAVVMVSAYDTPAHRQDAADAGADDYLVKTSIVDVPERVAEVLRRNEAADATEPQHP